MRVVDMGKTVAEMVSETRKSICEIDCSTLENLLANNSEVLLVDVRDKEEYEKYHLPNAIHAPRGHIEFIVEPNRRRSIPELVNGRDKEVVVYCKSGTRAAFVCKVLREMGFEKVSSLKGGIDLWEAEGGCTVR
jgi:Rhodanese-related sulfurtransferase